MDSHFPFFQAPNVEVLAILAFSFCWNLRVAFENVLKRPKSYWMNTFMDLMTLSCKADRLSTKDQNAVFQQ